MNAQLILLGAPGTGKGTQAKNLKKKFGYEHLSTGDLLRKEINDQTPIGQKVQKTIKAGQLVEDSIVIDLLKKNCDLAAKNYIFDGFPRNLAQAKMLDQELLKGHKYRVVYLEMKYQDLVDRIVYRRVCGQCGKIFNLKFNPPAVAGQCDQCGNKDLIQREDDREDILKNRFDVFLTSIKEVVDFYKKKNVLAKIDASGEQDFILKEIQQVL